MRVAVVIQVLINADLKAVPIKSGILFKPAPESHQATEEEISLYLQICMSLMYLMLIARPEMAYAVGLAARFVKNPFSTRKAYASKRKLKASEVS